ncbi:MAG: hypothetical protein R2844_21045 [Caldilineales bacterium]
MTSNPRPNPYVGARPYQQGETLYGRSREQRRLLNQLIADRIVLLNSPSGAGKTSLVQAALIPDLVAEHFNVLPVARVNTELPKELAGRADVNRYLLSLLLSLDEGLSKDREPTSLDALAATSLDDYLAAIEAANPDKSIVLIVDQFEEIVTVDPTDDAGRQVFFDALSIALRNRRRWALFAMREEFVTRLDPLARMVPTRLGMRFRLELLSPEGALEAIQGPPGEQHVTFDSEAAAVLVNDLRTVRVQQDDGNSLETLGNAVEPVQLQVVCQRLWNGLAADDMAIGADDVAALGDVSKALQAYYDEQVSAVAAGQVDEERAIRDWFETQLITAQGIRTQIAQEPGATRGLNNDLIGELVDRRLVRIERRRAVNFYELAHDRLIRPMQTSNAAWRETHLAGWQQQAILWDQQGRPVDLLLTGSKLAGAEQEAAGRSEDLAALDRAFLDASRDRRRQRRQRTILSVGGVLLAVVIVLAGLLIVRVVSQARTDARKRESARLTALGESLQYSEPDLAALLAVEAEAAWNDREGTDPVLKVLTGNPRLRHIVRLAAASSAKTALDGHFAVPAAGQPNRAAVDAVAISPRDGTVAAASDNSVYLIDRASGKLAGGAPLTLDKSSAVDLAFSPDGQWLAAAQQDGNVTLWDVGTDPPTSRSFKAVAGTINSLAFAPAGDRLLVVGKNNVTSWPVTGGEDAQGTTVLAGVNTTSVAVSPDGRTTAVGHDDGTVSLLTDASRTTRTLAGPAGRVKSVAFSPDGASIAAAIQTRLTDLGEAEVLVWPTEGGDPSNYFVSDSGAVNSIAFVEDGKALATAGRDNRLVIWDLDTGLPEGPLPAGHRSEVLDLAYDPNTETLVSGDGQGRVFIWRFDTANSLATPLEGHTDQVYTVAFSPGGAMLASGGRDGTARLWDVANQTSQILGDPDQIVVAVAFSPDGELLAAGESSDIKLWQVKPDVKLLQVLPGAGPGTLTDVAFAPDGKTLASADRSSGAITLWDLTQTPPRSRILTTDEQGPLTLAFSPDGRRLYGANLRGDIWALDVSTGQQVQSLNAEQDVPILDIAVSSDGKLLAAAGANSAVYLWDLEEGLPYGAGILAGHSLPVSGVAFNRTSDRLASVSLDGRLILWNVDSQQPVGVFQGHDGPINGVAFSTDGRSIATAGDDHIVNLWAATQEQWQEAACELARRSFTDDEIDRFFPNGQTPGACSGLAESASQ